MLLKLFIEVIMYVNILVSVKQSAQPLAATNGKIVNGDEEDEHFFEKVIQEAKLLASREKRQTQAAKKLAVKSKQVFKL